MTSKRIEVRELETSHSWLYRDCMPGKYNMAALKHYQFVLRNKES
jgi:hypothetical protein